MIRAIAPHRIQALPEHLVNQIAAGEVIERPASVVKELVENSIDAGASTISVAVEDGGKRVIRIQDDGCGIHPEDLPLALASHATSKLRTSDDLQRIRTLGFRGEALASIASVAEVELVSRTAGHEAAECVRAARGVVERGPPVPLPPGTRITVRNLFHDVPARMRFLKSSSAELARITTWLEQLALAQPGIGFRLTSDGREVFDLPAAQTLEERVREVLGEERMRQMLPIEEGGRLSGWVSRPEVSRRDAQGIHLFLNGRAVREAATLHALRQGYQGFQIPGKYPVAVLFLTVDPAEVDVNVHPAKLEVRLRDSSAVHSLVLHAVARTLREAQSVPALFAGRAAPTGSAPPSAAPVTAATHGAPLTPATLRGAAPASREFAREGSDLDWRALLPATLLPAMAPRALEPTQTSIEGREVRVFQVHDSYLFVEEAEGLTIIDQHALHEKILYEQICAAPAGPRLVQPLLLPETFRLDLAEWALFPESEPVLAELGFDIAEFGERTVIVRAIPAGFEEVSIAALLRDALRSISAQNQRGAPRPAAHELRERIVSTMACKRAVKAGQRLSKEAQLDLLAGRARAFQPRNCPHGRPAEIFIRWDELDRRFDRR